MDRRELIKRFGIGAIIAPVIGGVVERSASAELIKVPDIKPVELFSKIPEPVDLSQVVSVQIALEMRDGQTRNIAIKWPFFEQRFYRQRLVPSLVGQGGGKFAVTDSLVVSLAFLRVHNTASPRAEERIGRLSGDAVLT